MTTNILNMSDEELANLDPATIVDSPPQEPEKPENDQAETDRDEVTTDAGDDTPNDEEQPGEGEGDEQVQTDEQVQGDDPKGKPTTPPNKDESGQGEQSTDGKEKPKPAETKLEGERNYKAELERILAPIKANGREIQVESVDDAIQLIKMGANYHKKMAALKPNMAVLKMLEQHGLLEQEKLSYLIDLSKKNPEAIRKLVKDSGIDPLDIDTKKEDTYKPQTYAVDETAVELDTVLDDLKGSTHYTQLLNIVGRDWDNRTREIIAGNPDLLRTLDAHMESGIFNKITSTMETERALGRLSGVSDIEAYRTVGDRLQAAGAFNGLVHQATAAPKVAPVKPAPKVETSETKEKKRAAAQTRTAPSGKVQPVNILNMSDEELDKLDITKFTTR